MDKFEKRQFIIAEVADLLIKHSSKPLDVVQEVDFADSLICDALQINKEQNPLDFILSS